MTVDSITRNLAECLSASHQQQLTGVIKVSSYQHYWLIYYVAGRIVLTQASHHPKRRWRRQLIVRSPAFWRQAAQQPYECWNYSALVQQVAYQRFELETLVGMVEACAAEDLFDMLQASYLQHISVGGSLQMEVRAQTIDRSKVVPLQHGRIWQQAQQNWQLWTQAGLADVSPNQVPVIAQPDLLQRTAPIQIYQTLSALVDGRNTFRDLSVKFRQPLVSLAGSILPYVSSHGLAIAEVPDIQVPSVQTPSTQTPSVQVSPATKRPFPSRTAAAGQTNLANNQDIGRRLDRRASRQADRQGANKWRKPSTTERIIYIDDSSTDSRLMAGIVERFGYQYTNIPDPIQALPMLIELKPELIFLDLVMPVANGYEVCAQIRRISAFKRTPVVIVTSNDGIPDRVRARFVGASGFLGKPIQQRKVSKVLRKHLPSFEERFRRLQAGGVFSSS